MNTKIIVFSRRFDFKNQEKWNISAETEQLLTDLTSNDQLENRIHSDW